MLRRILNMGGFRLSTNEPTPFLNFLQTLGVPDFNPVAFLVCPECGKPVEDERVENGLKCAACAGYGS
jgi:hypothetical protein